MTGFAYTPDLLKWIRAHASVMTAHDMAAHLGCAPSSLRNICANFRIELASSTDKHADLAPVPGSPIDEPGTAEPTVPPRLNPALRQHHLTGFIELRPQRDAVARLDRKAASLRTTPKVLAAVLFEIIAADDLFDAILDLDS